MTERDKSGKFKPGASGNSKGRPKGHGTAGKFRKQLETHADALIAKTVELALEGDTTALRICMDKILPSLKATAAPVQFTVNTNNNLTELGEGIIQAVGQGDLPPDYGVQMLNGLGVLANIRKSDELSQRVKELESEKQK